MTDEQRLAIAVDDEERVVDADAEADHGSERGREGCDVHEARHDVHEGEPHAQADERDDDRQTCRDDRTEGDEQDDDRDEDADRLTAGRLLAGELQDAALGSHTQAIGAIECLDRVQDLEGIRNTHLGAIADEGH